MNRTMRLSFAVSVFMLLIKASAFVMTHSSAILSDAVESVIHVVIATVAAYSLSLSLKPADENHLYGHDKIGFFSAGFEGAMIIMASCYIIFESAGRLIHGSPLENIGMGIGFLLLSIAINLGLGITLIRRGKKHHAIILEANGKHLLTDCYTSAGVIIALVLVKTTGLSIFDPIVAILVGLNILWTGGGLVKKSINGLMDQTDSAIHQKIITILRSETKRLDLEFHNLKDRVSGYKIFIEFHLLFSRDISLKHAHEAASEIEAHIKNTLDREVEIVTHLETKSDHDDIHKKYGLSI